MKSKKLKILTLVICIISALSILGYLCLPFFFDNIIKLEIASIIDQSSHGKATFRKIDISSYDDLPYLNISLDSIVLKDSIAGKSDTLFTAMQIAFSISLSDWLFDHKYVVRKINFTAPVLTAKKYLNKVNNFGFLSKNDSTALKSDTSKFNFKVNYISIENGYVFYKDFEEKTLVVAEKLNLKGALDISDNAENIKIKFETDDVVVKYNTITCLYKNTVSADIILDYNPEEKSIKFNDHYIQIDNFKFGFNGYLKQQTDTLNIDIQFKTSESKIKNLMSLIPGIYKKEYEKYKAKGEFSLEGEVKGFYNEKYNLTPSYFSHFVLKNGSFQYNHLPQSITDINLDLKFEKLNTKSQPTITLDKFQAKLDSNYISGLVTIVGMQKPFITGNLNSVIELHELDQYLKLDSLKMAGHLIANMTVSGIYDAEANKFPKMKGQILLSKGYFKRKGIDHALENVSMETILFNNSGLIQNTSLKLSKLSFNIDDEYLEMYGKMDDFKNYNFDLFLRSEIDLKKLSLILNIENQILTGSVNAKIIAKGSADKFKEAYISGTASFKDVLIRDNKTNIELGIKNGNVVFSPEMILLSNFDMTLQKESFAINGIVRNFVPYFLHEKASLQASIRFNADSLNLDNLLSVIVEKNSKTPTDTVKQDIGNLGTFSAFENINFEANMKVNHLIYDKYKFYDIIGNIKANSGQITIDKSSFNSVDASFFIQNAQITPSNFSMKLDIKELDTRKVMKLFSQVKTDTTVVQDETGAMVAINYKLKGDLDKELKPILNSLNGYGLISIDKANIKGLKILSHIGKAAEKDDLHHQDIHDLMILTEIKGGKVHIQPFTVNLGKYLANFEGTHSFENEINYFIKLGIPPFHKIKIPMHVTGTLDKPEVSISKKKK